MTPGAPPPEGRSASGSPRHLILFGKVPEPGSAKTRLAPELGEEGAARLYSAFLEDTVRLSCEVSGVERRSLWLAGDEAGRERIRDRLGDEAMPVRAQQGPDLGARMASALEDAFFDGAGRALIVGTDHPTLPPDRLERAFHWLRDVDLALGPSDDGGYYAVGVRRSAWPRGAEIFRGIPWSTGRVLEETRSRADGAGLSRRELEPWYDVDRPEELDRLRRDAGPGSASARVLRELED